MRRTSKFVPRKSITDKMYESSLRIVNEFLNNRGINVSYKDLKGITVVRDVYENDAPIKRCQEISFINSPYFKIEGKELSMIYISKSYRIVLALYDIESDDYEFWSIGRTNRWGLDEDEKSRKVVN